MKKIKQARLEAQGWRVGSASAFLKLSPEESAYLEMKVELSRSLLHQRKRKRLTQLELARILKSSQSRVAKMESGDPSVSLDLLVRSLLALGMPKKALLRSLPLPR